MNMSIEKVVSWYNENVNYKITKSFLNFLINIGLVKEDIDLDFLNLYMLEKNSNDFIIENGRYKIKPNRLSIISRFKDEIVEKIEPVKKPIVTFTRGNKKETKQKNKFKIESVGGNRLKLVKL